MEDEEGKGGESKRREEKGRKGEKSQESENRPAAANFYYTFKNQSLCLSLRK